MEDLNAKWQCYDASRDEYVKELHAQLRGLQAPHGPERPSPPELLRKEISRLNRQLEERVNDCEATRLELAAMRTARDAALERAQMLEQQVPATWDTRTGPVGTSSFLEWRWHGLVTAECLVSFQILVYKDDFTSERADRERAQSRIQELEEMVVSLQRQVSRRQVGPKGSAPPEHT